MRSSIHNVSEPNSTTVEGWRQVVEDAAVRRQSGPDLSLSRHHDLELADQVATPLEDAIRLVQRPLVIRDVLKGGGEENQVQRLGRVRQ
jgi:hypothetical protein